MLSEKWQNHGDVNHREQGGIFLKYDSKWNEIEIVQTSDVSELEGIEGNYLFEPATVSVEDLLEDRDLASFAGAKEDFDEDKKLAYLATSYVAYYGSDDGGNIVNNYWEELGSHGITRSEARNI